MRRNIIDKITTHNMETKKKIHEYIDKNINKIENNKGEDFKQELLQYIYDIENLELNDKDFIKRKRIANKIPNYERCCAKKSCGIRCTRKKKEGNYCGTHCKGIPYGAFDDDSVKNENEVNVWLEEIKGIHQYIDKDNNVYSSEDIVNSLENPRIIASWKRDLNGKYFIVK